MEQLGALDNLMIAGEIPNLPMHMSAMVLYRTGGTSGADELYTMLHDRIDHATREHFQILRCRAERLPLELDRAYWVEDAHFTPTYHLSRVALGGSHDWAALHQILGEFHARPLDMARPLWQVLLVDGLDNVSGIPGGSSALLFKIHHGAMDGKGAINLVRSLHSRHPGGPADAETAAAHQTKHDFRAPSLIGKYGRAWWHAIERPVELVGTLAKLLPGLLQTTSGKSAPLPTPPTPFNQPVTPDRVTGHLRLSMRSLKRLRKKLDCTINDLALTVVGGALRDLLQERGELPDDAVTTLMPIDLRKSADEGDIGNHVTVARLSLATDLQKPRDRLTVIKAATRERKSAAHGPGGGNLVELVDEVHPALVLWLGQWLIESGHIEDLPQTTNTVVTNVPGFKADAYLGKAQVLDYLGLGPLAPNMGLFHTVSSTRDHVNITFLGTRAGLEDGSQYGAALARAWARVKRL